jgi:hypothetical protein
MEPLQYLSSHIAELDVAIRQLEDSATTPQEEATLRRLVEIRSQLQVTSDLLGNGRPVQARTVPNTA